MPDREKLEIEQDVRRWADAYPVEIFPELTSEEWSDVRTKLGDSLLSRVSASNMRHVITKIAAMFDANAAAGGGDE